MLDDSRLNSILDFAQQALELARTHKVAPTAAIFEVLLAYVVKEQQDVTGLVEKALKDGGQDLEDTLITIHHEFFGPAVLQHGLQRIRADLENQIDTVTDRLKFGIRGNLELNAVLRDSMREAASTTTKEQLVTICKNVVLSSRDHLNTTQSTADQLKNAQQELGELYRELSALRESAFKDHLTGLMNRRYLDEKLDQILQVGDQFCFALIDIDHFKRINDTWGHAVGDNILRGLGRLLTDNTKGRDFAARVGGEEFALVLPKTPLGGAVQLCDSMRAAFADILWISQATNEEMGKFSFSCGVTEWRKGEVASSLYDRADSLLYNAKKSGRNRISADGG